jgi:hypothetical protein
MCTCVAEGTEREGEADCIAPSFDVVTCSGLLCPGGAGDPLGQPGALEDMQQDRSERSGGFLVKEFAASICAIQILCLPILARMCHCQQVLL